MTGCGLPESVLVSGTPKEHKDSLQDANWILGANRDPENHTDDFRTADQDAIRTVPRYEVRRGVAVQNSSLDCSKLKSCTALNAAMLPSDCL